MNQKEIQRAPSCRNPWPLMDSTVAQGMGPKEWFERGDRRFQKGNIGGQMRKVVRLGEKGRGTGEGQSAKVKGN